MASHAGAAVLYHDVMSRAFTNGEVVGGGASRRNLASNRTCLSAGLSSSMLPAQLCAAWQPSLSTNYPNQQMLGPGLAGKMCGWGNGSSRNGQSPRRNVSAATMFGNMLGGIFKGADLGEATRTVASLRPPSGKGFGKRSVNEKKVPSQSSDPSSREDENLRRGGDGEDDDDDVVPEVVTNRMLKRIALTVGVPLAFGILLFPLFYVLKVVNKVDVPEWLPLIVSLFTFGTAGFGITYGVVSTSWDPAREGSLLGWKEAQVNWPLIWQKVKGNK